MTRPDSVDADVLKGMLQGLEHTLSALDAASAAATQLIEAQRSGKPLSPKTLDHYTSNSRRSRSSASTCER